MVAFTAAIRSGVGGCVESQVSALGCRCGSPFSSTWKKRTRPVGS